MSIAPQDAVAASIRSLHGTLSVATALVAAGRHVDLSGLDRDVTAVCVAAAVLPPADGRALRGELAALLAAVRGLEARFAPP
ncbi:hypothetical protein [Roseomonas sp. BN140053]|uniref:hypothetical protein n=1 Tax=Roseomonas sp. BN140053 TaxID=3391898 RepID=UPI0039EBC597